MSVATGTPRRHILRRTNTANASAAGEVPRSPSAAVVPRPTAVINRLDDMFPLNAPGIALPGSDFMRMAADLGDTLVIEGKGRDASLTGTGEALQELYRRALYSSGDFVIPITVKGHTRKPMTVLGGHVWGDGDESVSFGPRRASVMVIGKCLGEEERNQKRNFCGQSAELLLEACRSTETRCRDWYVTNLLKTEHPDAGGSSTVKQSWVREWLPLLQQELRIVRPTYILCLGADVAKALLGKHATVANMEGRVIELEIPLDRSRDSTAGLFHTALLMVCPNPAAVLHAPEQAGKFEDAISRFGQLARGLRWDKEEADLDHRQIDTIAELEDLVAEVAVDCEDNLVAIDAEWHGEHPQNKGSYLRTVQISWKAKTAACICLRGAGGVQRIEDIPRALQLFAQMCKGRRVSGHFSNADMEWLLYHGVDLREEFAVAESWLQCMEDALVHKKGGYDTALALHAADETGDFALTPASLRHTTAPRYDVELIEWKKRFCAEHKMKDKDLEGYGDCPDGILVGTPIPGRPGKVKNSYACYDADVARRLVFVTQRMLTRDRFGNNCWEAFWMAMRANPVPLEIKMTGVVIDRERVDKLTDAYVIARKRLLATLRTYAQWPKFNPDSVFQVREFLFGEELNGKDHKPGSPPIMLRPEGAVSLKLQPITTSDKRPMRWEDVVQQGLENAKTASTNKTALAILAQESQEVPRYDDDGNLKIVDLSQPVMWLRDYRFISQVLKSSLRMPVLNKEDEFVLDDRGNRVYPGGIPASVCGDGRIRTTVYTVKETRRWSSARPALQNLCFDPLTEILTRRGWVLFPLLRDDDIVAQYWPDRQEIDFVRPTERQCFDYSGDMIQIGGEQFDQLVTPNHRCLLRTRKTQRVFEVAAEDMPAGNGCEHRYIHAGCYAGGSISLPWAEVAWLCAVQADGHYVNGFETGQGFSFAFVKERKQQRLRRLLTELDAHWSERVADDGKVVFYVGVNDNRNLIARTKELFGDTKEWGPWLLNLDRLTLDMFVEEVLQWDGLWARQSEYSSSDRQSADWVQILWSLSGIRARMRLYRNSNPNSRDHHCVNIPVPRRRRDFTAISDATLTRQAYSGPVYCVTVPSSFVMVRRNGKVSISGNSKRREADYKRILGPDYSAPIRSIVTAPKGHVIVEADWIGAELFLMAIMSGDPSMIEHARRNQLPEDHANYYDIHSNIAVLAFGYDCPPTKGGLAAIGKKHMRIVAKAVIFGAAYGRGAKAIALSAKEEGVNITVQEAQQVIDAIFQMYPRLVAFFDKCKRRAVGERWICGPYGGFRRFPRALDSKMAGDFERQAMNFPIQNGIADAMNRAVDYLYHYRETHHDVDYQIALQIHDAVMLYVPLVFVPKVIDEVLPFCMVKSVPIYPTELDGTPTGTGPYHLGIDVEASVRWGESLNPEQCLNYGFNPKYAKWIEHPAGWLHPEKLGKIWVDGKFHDLGEFVKA